MNIVSFKSDTFIQRFVFASKIGFIQFEQSLGAKSLSPKHFLRSTIKPVITNHWGDRSGELHEFHIKKKTIQWIWIYLSNCSHSGHKKPKLSVSVKTHSNWPSIHYCWKYNRNSSGFMRLWMIPRKHAFTHLLWAVRQFTQENSLKRCLPEHWIA